MAWDFSRYREVNHALSRMSAGAVSSTAGPTSPLELAYEALGSSTSSPLQGMNILVAIDAHPKWVEAVCTSSMSSTCVIEELRSLFARFGLPELVVTDNGTCFVSSEFKDFLRVNGVKHSTSAPYHPASNGLAEHAVQIVKQGLKKDVNGTMRSRLAIVLLAYRATPQSTTGQTPAELLLGRQQRTCLDLLKPNTAERVEHKQQQQKKRHDGQRASRNFQIGQSIFVRNYGVGSLWLPAKIVARSGPVSFRVKLDDGRQWRCHQDQLRTRIVRNDPPEMSEVPVEQDGEAPFISPLPATSSCGSTEELPHSPLELVPGTWSRPTDTRLSLQDLLNTSDQPSMSDSIAHRYPR